MVVVITGRIMNEKETYFVAVKVFLEDKGKLFIFKDSFGDWDSPGGRVRKDEFETPLEDIIKRKMKEEVGDDVKYTLGEPVVFMRHERIEALPDDKPTVRIFAVGYEAKYEGGEIKLGEYHEKMEWVNIKDFKPEDYFTGGWLKGVKDYLNR